MSEKEPGSDLSVQDALGAWGLTNDTSVPDPNLSIQDALSGWNLSINPDDFGWEDRTFPPCRQGGKGSCLHPNGRTFNDFLNTPVDHFGADCTFFTSEDPHLLESLFCLAVDYRMLRDLKESESLEEHNFVAGHYFEEANLPLQGEHAGRETNDIVREKIVERIKETPERFYEAFLHRVSHEGEWIIPEKEGDSEPLVYISGVKVTTAPNGDHRISTNGFAGLSHLASHYVGLLSREIFIVPRRFLRFREEGSELENQWLSNYRERYGEEFYSFLSRPVADFVPVESSDDASVHEALIVFAKSMPLTAAVAAARAI